MSAPNFVCILGNYVISHLVPKLVEWLFVDNDVPISSVIITIGWNIEQRSASKLSGICFHLCGKVITVFMDNVEASLGTKVLFGSFVKSNVFLGIGGLKVVVWIC